MKIILLELKKSALGFEEAEVNDRQSLKVTYTSHNVGREEEKYILKVTQSRSPSFPAQGITELTLSCTE